MEKSTLKERTFSILYGSFVFNMYIKYARQPTSNKARSDGGYDEIIIICELDE